MRSLRRTSCRLGLCAMAGICVTGLTLTHGALAHQPPAAAQSAKLRTDYRIFKIYVNARIARIRGRAAADDKTNLLVLRYGNGKWGLDHLKAKHNWGNALDNAIQNLVDDPKTKVRSEGGGSYRWDNMQWFKGELCDFRAIENRNPLSDGHEKGIITAYALAPCGEVFA